MKKLKGCSMKKFKGYTLIEILICFFIVFTAGSIIFESLTSDKSKSVLDYLKIMLS